MPKTQERTGLLMCRTVGNELQVLLVHPGRLYFRCRDEGDWSIPKGEPGPDEDLLEAVRNSGEEVGVALNGPFFALTSAKQKEGEAVHAWAFEGDCDPAAIISNTFTIEWPPRSGRHIEFPEIDRAGFFGLGQARR